MSRPQQPELERSGHTPVDEARHSKEVAGAPPPGGGKAGPVPPANRPGHHPEAEQDQPDLDRFRERASGGDQR
jgi:hypothetical protein